MKIKSLSIMAVPPGFYVLTNLLLMQKAALLIALQENRFTLTLTEKTGGVQMILKWCVLVHSILIALISLEILKWNADVKMKFGLTVIAPLHLYVLDHRKRDKMLDHSTNVELVKLVT